MHGCLKIVIWVVELILLTIATPIYFRKPVLFGIKIAWENQDESGDDDESLCRLWARL